MTAFEQEMRGRIERINSALDSYLKPREPALIYRAMRYSLLSGGKRLRPLLLLASYEAYGGSGDVTAFACGLEMIHCYSLIHDDLPCMDDDGIRRGKPTNHIMFGAGIATLAGDALLNLAYETMIAACIGGETVNGVRAMREIAEAAGVLGMIGGQVMDLCMSGQVDKSIADSVEAQDTVSSDERLRVMQTKKTGALLAAAACAGAVLAGAGGVQVERAKKLAYNLGLAFQIKDDIMDEEGGEKFGKPLGSDRENHKATYVSLHGIQKAHEDYTKLCNQNIAAASELDPNGRFLRPLVEYIGNREY